MKQKYIVTMILMAVVAFSACEEMPELLPEDVIRDPRLISGPYIIEGSDQDEEAVYMRTNVAAIAGLKVVGSKEKMVRRYGRSSKQHKINLTPLIDKSIPDQKFEVLLDDFTSSLISLKHPQDNTVTTIGFLGGGKGREELLSMAARKLLTFAPVATILTGGSFPLDEKISTWDTSFFTPIQPLTPTSPLLMLPEDRAILPIEAGRGGGLKYWSRSIGSVHICFIDMDSLKKPAERAEVLGWLTEDLAANPDMWRVLVLGEPLFAAQRIYARAVEAFGTILESGGVDLVVSGGGDYYQRTLPIQAAGSKPVRYIVTGGISTGKGLPVGREYRAAVASRPHVAVLSADSSSLEWKAVALDNAEILDIVTINKEGLSTGGEPAIEKMDILTDALSALSLQREVVTIATQAAKAVNNPDKSNDISFVLANASPENIKGELMWDIPYDSAYVVEPAAVKFGLDSGYEGKAVFKVKPLTKGADASLPVLKVNIQGVGSASQPLILSKRKYADIKRWNVEDAIVIDGAMKEKTWSSIPSLEGFTVLATGGEPKQPFEAKVSYDNRGIYVLARAAADKPEQIVTQAKNHDDPVHRDESIEIFIDPKNNGRDYFQFAVNTKGVMLDRSNAMGLAWNPNWEVAVESHSSYYTVEAFIPYQALGLSSVPNNGSKWGFNICRNDYQASAVRENPFKTEEVPDILSGKVRVSRTNIGDLAEQELGETVEEEDVSEKAGPGFEVVQWADTFGDNSRSGLYGQIHFAD